ncbi:putative TAM domain methyltransferase [Kalaharituber pfeilii]|nr:putative TAM domain methyltransferase [Kalaharituber pfeilii]
MPNDEREQDRLDLYHHIFLSLMGGKLYTAPIENPKRILDVGTGTGIWAIDMADEHPQAEIIGTDLSPIQPSWVPPNCRFEVEDMEAEWPYEKNYFDMIHIRTLSGCVNDWDFVLRQAYKHLQPGGYIDFQDYGCELFLPDGTPAPDDTVDNCPLGYYVRVMNEAYLKIGRILQVAKHMKSWLENLGFLDVQEQRVIWPLGQWPKDPKLKELGKWGYIGACESLVPFALGLLTKMEGWTTQQVEDLAVRVKRDLGRGGGKYYCEGWFITARKPKRGEL